MQICYGVRRIYKGRVGYEKQRGKEQIKAQLKDKYPASASTSVNLPSPDVLSKINDNINTIKNILMFYLILSIVGIFFMIINFLV